MDKHEGKVSFLKHSKLFLDNAFKRKSMLFVAALVAALSSLVAGWTPALASAPQVHDQGPGYFRLKIGDLEVTVLFDASVAFDEHWLNGKKATMDGVVKALQQDPHLLDASDTGFPEVTVVFDADPAAAAATRNQLLPRLAREDVVIAAPHLLFPGPGRLHKDGKGYSWAPVAFNSIGR